jgi:hypothetical protein
VSVHITALAISGMMVIGVSCALFVGNLIVGPVGSDSSWFACCTVYANLSFDKFCWRALHLAMGCGVLGITGLAGVGLNLRCEFGVVMVVTVGCITLEDVAPFITLGGETAICTLGGALLSLILNRGDIVSYLRAGSAPSKIAPSRLRASICSSPT